MSEAFIRQSDGMAKAVLQRFHLRDSCAAGGKLSPFPKIMAEVETTRHFFAARFPKNLAISKSTKSA